MAYVRDPTKSTRDNICLYFVDLFEGLQAGVGGYTTTWSTVSRTPLSSTEESDGNAIAIIEHEEKKTMGIGFQMCHLTLITEFRYRRQEGDDAASEINRVLVDIQRAMGSDNSCSGMAIDLTEKSNLLDLPGPNSVQIGGYIAWHLEYRQSLSDPLK